MTRKGEVRIPAGVIIWPHELATVQLLAEAGYIVEFLLIKQIRGIKSPDILIDSRRMSKVRDSSIQQLLTQKLKQQKVIKKLIFINRKHQVIDVAKLT